MRNGFIVFGAIALAISAGAAPASAKPRLAFSLPAAGGDAGKPTPFTFTTAAVNKGARVVLQRQQGTRNVWRTVVKLRRVASGTGNVPALSLGSYKVRIAAVNASGKILTSRTKSLRVFGDVSFVGGFGGSEHVITTPTATFRYALETQLFGVGQGRAATKTIATASGSTCRSVHVAFVATPYSVNDTATTSSVTVVRESADPVSASAPQNGFAEFDAPLKPGESWSLNATAIDSASGFANVWVNGHASCYQSGSFQ